jgi:hypothetical protein
MPGFKIAFGELFRLGRRVVIAVFRVVFFATCYKKAAECAGYEKPTASNSSIKEPRSPRGNCANVLISDFMVL